MIGTPPPDHAISPPLALLSPPPDLVVVLIVDTVVEVVGKSYYDDNHDHHQSPNAHKLGNLVFSPGLDGAQDQKKNLLQRKLSQSQGPTPDQRKKL